MKNTTSHSKKILGIAGYYHDSSATLVIDGEIVAAAQEERFSRIKHDPSFPTKAIEYCLAEAELLFEDLDTVIFYDKPMLKFERLLETYLSVAPKGFFSFLKAMPIWLKEKLYLKSILRMEYRKLIHKQRAVTENNSIDEQVRREKKPKLPKMLFSEHHQSHAASAYFPSPYNKAVVLCLDGVGEWATSSVWKGEGNQLTPLWDIHFPHSLGLLYSAFTYYCGFRVNSGEYKLMGLAPYGEPTYVDLIYKELISVKQDGSFSLNMKYFDYPAGNVMTSKLFDRLFGGPARTEEQQIEQKQMDMARSIQVVTEDIVLKIAHYAFKETGCENLCLAGGVALNCVANGRIYRQGPFKSIWIQPAAGDAGGSLGAALLTWFEYYQNEKIASHQHAANKNIIDDKMQGSYLGPAFKNSVIEKYLIAEKIDYKVIDEACLYKNIAELIDNVKVIGWFQGRMEFGPRALGNRTIVGDPRSSQMQKVMNLKIKKRESFRPFAPAVLAEDVEKYFKHNSASPYMLMVAEIQDSIRVDADANSDSGSDAMSGSDLNNSEQGFARLKQQRSTLPAITHVDYSARIQTVHQHTNPQFHALIEAFKQRTGIGVLINTSFNVRGEPPVCSPEDAVQCFLRTEMDYLVMNNIILDKNDMRKLDIDRAKEKRFKKD